MTKRTMRLAQGVALSAFLAGNLALTETAAALKAQAPSPDASALNIRYGDIKWQRITPELGERSPEVAILHVDPVTQATQLMIRVPKDTHVPMHWHTANETHTVIKGTFIVECDGKHDALEQGSFNYIPSKMRHEAWTRPDEGALLFITVDSAWDIHWVGDPKDVLGGSWR
jgi:quercetin dioxygenase-like cupin family protein